jgi:hypothetical protein
MSWFVSFRNACIFSCEVGPILSIKITGSSDRYILVKTEVTKIALPRAKLLH